MGKTPYLSASTPHHGGSGMVRPIFLCLMSVALLALANAASAQPNPLIHSRLTASNDIRPFTKWTEVMPRYEMQRQSASDDCYGDGCKNHQWEKMLSSLAGSNLDTQLVAINDFFNAMPYIKDAENFGTNDYWQTPYELMERGGDCEDYAIAKYISLRRLGIAENTMRIIVVKDEALGGTIHAVLEVIGEDGAQILDNQDTAIRAAAEVFHYQPMFAINESAWWSYSAGLGRGNNAIAPSH
jgi:predicted transglutaminase-like cysteine proteinase